MRKTFLLPLFLFALVAPPAQATYSIYAYWPGLEGEGVEPLNEEVDLPKHANMARCLCDEAAGEGEEYSFYLEMSYSGPYDTVDHYYFLGSDCGNTAVPLDQCQELATLSASVYRTSNRFIPIPVNRLVDPDGGVCSEINSGSNTYYIFSSRENRDQVFTQTFSFDTQPPSAPTNVRVSPGEGGLTVEWDHPTTTEDGVGYFNILCMRQGVPGEAASEEKADWTDPEEVCGKYLTYGTTNPNNVNNTNTTNNANNTNNTNNANNTNTTAGTGKGLYPMAPRFSGRGVQPGGSGIQKADLPLTCPNYGVVAGGRAHKCYVCGTVTEGTTSYRINGLENGVEYTVAVVAVDEHRNVSVVSPTALGIPEPMIDFAEHYRESGGSGRGDYCFIATAVYGSKHHAVVQILRHFRDQVLRKTAAGRALVRYYYAHGPLWAQQLENRPLLAFFVKVVLLVFALFAVLFVITPWWMWFGFLLFGWYLFHRQTVHRVLRRVRLHYA